MVTHDLDFAARVSERTGLIFAGMLTSLSDSRDFFSGNTFYTTPANRIARSLYPEALTEEEVIAFAKKYGISVLNSLLPDLVFVFSGLIASRHLYKSISDYICISGCARFNSFLFEI